ncbi:BPI fold-containing family B member 6-like [Anolis sagrei]|uniref:BPI fold-containing family B member 6-like n=1 Tax=Anolis sagrei TaxID=38937 RepID=UPI0035202370
MRLDLEQAWIGFLLLLACSWVILCEKTHETVRVRVNVNTVQTGVNRAIMNSNILEEVAESAAKDQGGAKVIKGIKGLKVKDIRPPIVSVGYVPDEGTEMSIVSQMTVGGKSFIGGPMEITVKSNMTVFCNIKRNDKEVVLEMGNCKVDLISCNTSLPANMLPKIVNKFLNSTLTRVLPGMMCPAAEKVLEIMREHLTSSLRKHKIGDHGDIEYKLIKNPEISQDGVILCFETSMHDKNGDKIETLHRTEMPKEMPPKKEGYSDILFSTSFLDDLMKMFMDDFHCDVNKAKVPSLTIGKLAKMIPSISKSLPASKAVKAEIRLKEPVKHSLGPNGSYMTVHSTVSFIPEPKGKSLISFDMFQRWDLEFAVEHEKLKLKIKSVSTKEIKITSKSPGKVEMEPLKKLMQNIVKTACMPAVNKALSDNLVPLPNLMGAKYEDSTKEFNPFEDTMMLRTETKKADYTEVMKKVGEIASKSHP